MIPEVSPTENRHACCQERPAVSAAVPTGELDKRQQLRLLAAQLVVQLSGGGLSVSAFQAYVKAVERFIDKGTVQ